MSEIPNGAYIEIVEKTKSPDAHPQVIVPNEVRINGIPLLAADEPIRVHEVSTSAHDLVRVTLTLIARRVEFKTEAAV